VWLETRKKVEVELQLLHRLLEDHSDLLEPRVDAPDRTEILATAALLHSFYTGIENIFKRISLEVDGAVPSGPRSHTDLLVLMQQPTHQRPEVISEELGLRLGEYLSFRHVFRSAYSFHLNWAKMEHPVSRCRETLRQLEAELDLFFDEG
jgi:hypothetical protein